MISESRRSSITSHVSQKSYVKLPFISVLLNGSFGRLDEFYKATDRPLQTRGGLFHNGSNKLVADFHEYFIPNVWVIFTSAIALKRPLSAVY